MPGDNGHMLVIRLSAMGDVAMTVHALRSLRSCHPRARVTLLTRPHFIPFFKEFSSDRRVDFLPFDSKGRHRGARGLLRLAGDARRLGVDCVADLHDVLRTKVLRLLLRMKGCRCATIDKENRTKSRATRTQDKDLQPVRHSVLRYCDVFGALGYPVCDPQPRRVPRPIPPFAGEKQGRWIGVAPFSKQRSKSYPEQNAARLVTLLAGRYERVFVFSGGGGEQEFARRMEASHENVCAVFGRITLDEEVDLMANLDAVVTMDSSAMHMASLVGTRVLSLWGATHPSTGFSGFGTSERNYVQLELPCRPCSVYGNITCRYGDYRCLRDLPPQLVLERLDTLLSGE